MYTPYNGIEMNDCRNTPLAICRVFNGLNDPHSNFLSGLFPAVSYHSISAQGMALFSRLIEKNRRTRVASIERNPSSSGLTWTRTRSYRGTDNSPLFQVDFVPGTCHLYLVHRLAYGKWPQQSDGHRCGQRIEDTDGGLHPNQESRCLGTSGQTKSSI